MKNEIVKKVLSNRVVGEVGKFYLAHESTILSGGAMGLSMATTAMTYRNADKIKDILRDAAYILADLKEKQAPKEEINKFYGEVLKELTPLVLPILALQAGTIGCIMLNKKHSDKLEGKLAETAGALSIAQAAVSQYQNFQKSAEEAMGEKKYMKLQQEIDDSAIYECSFVPIGSNNSDTDQLFYEPITGQVFWSNVDRINLAWSRYHDEIQNDESQFVPIGGKFFSTLGLDCSTASADVFGYINEDATKMHDEMYLDSTKVRVDGKEMSALKLTYYPTIRLSNEFYEGC